MTSSLNQTVAISAGSLAPGGVETHVRILAVMLRRAGHPVILYGTSCHWHPETMRQLSRAGVEFLISPRWTGCLPGLSGLWAVLRWRFGVSTGMASLYAIGAGRSHALLKKLVSPDVVSIYHEIVTLPDPECPAAKCMRVMNGALANSPQVAIDMSAICPDKPIRVIPFLTAEKAADMPARRALIGQRPLRVGYLGRLEERKRPHILVQEWAHLVTDPMIGPAELHLHGDDGGSGLMTRMQAEIRERGLTGQIYLHGGYQHGDLPEILAGMDLVVLPSQWEGLPLVLVEAMQHGVPFVATNAGGTAEFGEENPDVLVTGIPWDDFVEGLRQFVPRLRAGQIDGQRLHKWVEQRYGFEVVWPQWQEALLDSRRFFGFQ